METRQVRLLFPDLFEEVEAILFKYDPVGLNYEDNRDEYAPETGSIILRLKEASSQKDVHQIIYEEFVRWFGETSVGKKEAYVYIDAAKEIWQAWIKHSNRLS